MRKKWIVALAVVLGAGLLVVGAVAWVVFGPNTRIYQDERSVYVPRSASFAQVADSLESSGVLGSRTTFEWIGKLTGWANQVKAGHYTFGTGASNYRMLDVIRKGLQTPVQLTIPPGTRPEVMAAVAGRDMEFDGADFLAALQDTALAAKLGTDTAHLFAYMLPETYFFYWLTDAPTVVQKVKEQFDQFYQSELAAKAEAKGLSKEDVMTLASIVEWESGHEPEKPRLAGVYLNRLEQGWPLQADPTIQFALIKQEGKARRLLYEDYRLQHPYNTYLYAGLPPGPITNPSSSSLRSIANAESHDLMYFVARGDGSHTFSRTLTEHNRAAQQYYDLMRERRAAAADSSQ